MILNTIVVILACLGWVFFLGGTMGILRFPDFYTRLHAAGKLDTFGSLTLLFALALHNLDEVNLASILTSLKIMICMVFVFQASPTATHAIVKAGLNAGIPAWTRKSEGQ